MSPVCATAECTGSIPTVCVLERQDPAEDRGLKRLATRCKAGSRASSVVPSQSVRGLRGSVGYITPIHYDQVRIRIFGLVVNSTVSLDAGTDVNNRIHLPPAWRSNKPHQVKPWHMRSVTESHFFWVPSEDPQSPLITFSSRIEYSFLGRRKIQPFVS